MAWVTPTVTAQNNYAPKAYDPELIVERFAAAPDIVHPVNLAFDRRGRLLVIESHTHFRPPRYQGPPYDRIRVLEDTDGDGRADRITTFFEGTRATMDIAVHPDGAVYLATRNEILRLEDTDGDGQADRLERIAFLQTTGDYPHNGLSGLAFDSRGNLYFGLGENIGHDYRLTGTDGTALTGGGEGGNIYWCTADGKKLRRVATGFWNPFGVCTDIFGRVFAVDNDPDAMPPCRMLHVVEGGDYGYQFRYGRQGRHPFQSWNGQLPGTLPMVSGVGESPCEIVSYESDGLPREYLGNLFVTAWADHRIERYIPIDKGASVTAERKPFVQGGKDFRPVGLAVAPDGSLFVSDWVLRDYNLHGHGAIWHIRQRRPSESPRPTDAKQTLASLHRPLREAAARNLAQQGEEGRTFLRRQCASDDARIRAAALTALIDAEDKQVDLNQIATHDPLPPLRALAARALVARGGDARPLLNESNPPAVRLEAIGSLRNKSDRLSLLTCLLDPDPFIVHGAIHQLGQLQEGLAEVSGHSFADTRQRIGLLLAQRASGRPEARNLLPSYLEDTESEVRFLAAKWIADERLTEYRPLIAAALNDPRLPVRLCQAFATALARIDNKDVSDAGMAGLFFKQLTAADSSADVRIAALRLLSPAYKPLTIETLLTLLRHENMDVQLETVRMLQEHPHRRRIAVLLDVAKDRQRTSVVRAEALVGVAEAAQENVDAMLAFIHDPDTALRAEALRALTGVRLSAAQRAELEKAVQGQAASDLAARALGQPFAKDRPRPDDVRTWLERLEGPADSAAGRRIFFHPRLAGCAKCHRVAGRGQDVGPDLSAIGRTERRHLVESILQPDNSVAPHYQVWSLATTDGRTFTGMLLRTELDDYTYVDPQGNRFKLNTRDIAETRSLPRSLMPTGLTDLLTEQELRDVLAYLGTLR
jgi:putative membrane-bound dehydrogenase-like protein